MAQSLEVSNASQKLAPTCKGCPRSGIWKLVKIDFLNWEVRSLCSHTAIVTFDVGTTAKPDFCDINRFLQVLPLVAVQAEIREDCSLCSYTAIVTFAVATTAKIDFCDINRFLQVPSLVAVQAECREDWSLSI